MKRFPLVAVAAAIGLALLAGVAHTLRATTAMEIPPSNDRCYYNLWNCSYDGTAYWDGCDPNYQQGWITTTVAESICETYHAQ